jgi:hypothetical protein
MRAHRSTQGSNVMSAMSNAQLRLSLLALPEKERRDLTHTMIENSIGAASGCYTLVDMLLLVCPIDRLTAYVEIWQSDLKEDYER